MNFENRHAAVATPALQNVMRRSGAGGFGTTGERRSGGLSFGTLRLSQVVSSSRNSAIVRETCSGEVVLRASRE
jgi:hypothetical protein